MTFEGRQAIARRHPWFSCGLLPATGCLAAAGLFGCQAARPHGAALGPADVYPGDPYPTRVVALGPLGARYRLSPELSPFMRFITGQEEPPPSPLPRPLAVAVADKRVVACDGVWHAVLVIDPRTGSVGPLIRPGQPTPRRPVAVTADAHGRVYVADAAGASVFVVEPGGAVSHQWHPPGDQRGFKPVAVACTADRLFVVNAAAHCIEVFQLASGDWLGSIGDGDADAPGLPFPVAVATGPDNRLYVVDMFNGRVQIVDEAGKPVGQIGRPGNRMGQLARPRGVAVGPDGIVYVCDAATQTVQMFDSSGRVLMYFGGAGSSRGSMALPAGVCVDRSLLEVLADDIPAGFATDYLVLVANQIGEKGIGMYAVGMFEQDRERIAGGHVQP